MVLLSRRAAQRSGGDFVPLKMVISERAPVVSASLDVSSHLQEFALALSFTRFLGKQTRTARINR